MSHGFTKQLNVSTAAKQNDKLVVAEHYCCMLQASIFQSVHLEHQHIY